MSLALAVFFNYILQYYLADLKYWQAQYAQFGRNFYAYLLQKPNTAQKINQPSYAFILNALPYLTYFFLALYLQNNTDKNFDLVVFTGQLIFLILGVVHIKIPEVGPQKEGKNIEISAHYFKEIYLKTLLPLSLILMPYGYILLALYFNMRFFLHQNIMNLPIILEDIFENIITWIEEKFQLWVALIFALMSHQEEVWQGVRLRYTKYQDFLYQILYHASPMVTQIDFASMQKSHIYKNTTLILKRSLWAFALLFIVRSFFS